MRTKLPLSVRIAIAAVVLSIVGMVLMLGAEVVACVADGGRPIVPIQYYDSEQQAWVRPMQYRCVMEGR